MGPPTDYSRAIAKLEKAVRAELAEYHLHGMSVALVDDQDRLRRRLRQREAR